MDKPWLASYQAGAPEEVAYPEGMLLHHFLEHSAARFPNRPAAILPTPVGNSLYEGRLSYRDLERSANRFANGLRAMGVQKGDRVVLLLPNSPQFLIAYFGALEVGAVIVALNPLCSPGEIEAYLIDCAGETLVTMGKYYPAVKQVQPNTHVTRVITTEIKEYLHPLARTLFSAGQEKQEGSRAPLDRRDYSFRLILQHSPDTRPDVPLAPADEALIQYTRTASDEPLGAVLTHRDVVANVLAFGAWWPEAVPGREATLCIGSFHEPYGMLAAMLVPLSMGGACILCKPELPQALAAIDKYRPTLLAGIPPFYAGLVQYPFIGKHNLHSVQLYLDGNGPVDLEVQNSFEANGGQLVETFGSAETGGIAFAKPIGGPNKAGSIGVPLPGVSARIVDPDLATRDRTAGEVGLLAVQGPQISQAYWNRPDEMNKRLLDGCLVTGEMAWMDEDGFFYLSKV